MKVGRDGGPVESEAPIGIQVEMQKATEIQDWSTREAGAGESDRESLGFG